MDYSQTIKSSKILRVGTFPGLSNSGTPFFNNFQMMQGFPFIMTQNYILKLGVKK